MGSWPAAFLKVWVKAVHQGVLFTSCCSLTASELQLPAKLHFMQNTRDGLTQENLQDEFMPITLATKAANGNGLLLLALVDLNVQEDLLRKK